MQSQRGKAPDSQPPTLKPVLMAAHTNRTAAKTTPLRLHKSLRSSGCSAKTDSLTNAAVSTPLFTVPTAMSAADATRAIVAHALAAVSAVRAISVYRPTAKIGSRKKTRFVAH
jgi:hypothetical protein